MKRLDGFLLQFYTWNSHCPDITGYAESSNVFKPLSNVCRPVVKPLKTFNVEVLKWTGS